MGDPEDQSKPSLCASSEGGGAPSWARQWWLCKMQAQTVSDLGTVLQWRLKTRFYVKFPENIY